MKIVRFCYSHEGTFGYAELGGKTFYFVEPPWKDNRAFESCIPEGQYGIRRDMTGEYRGFEITNVEGRSEIEIHCGNIKHDTVGCLVIGKALGYVKGHWAVVNSKAAMREFKQLMQQHKPTKVTVTSVFSKAMPDAVEEE